MPPSCVSSYNKNFMIFLSLMFDRLKILSVYRTDMKRWMPFTMRIQKKETIFIVRSNKRAKQYNQQIRTRILDNESEISSGDYVMVVKNNYFWLKDSKVSDFIANGDILEILQIYKHHDLYGFRFALVK